MVPGSGKKLFASAACIILFSVILVAMVSVAGTGRSSGKVCGACHSMKPQYLTWQLSAHSTIGCSDCHADRGLRGSLQVMSDLGRYITREISGDYERPIRMFDRIDDHRCLDCHDGNNLASVSSNVKISHNLHALRKVNCSACHSAMAHGAIALRGETTLPEEWDGSRALAAMARENTVKPMYECMDCHTLRKVSNDCTSCHVGMELPAYHLSEDFSQKHGISAYDELSACNTCHGYANRKMLQVAADTSIRGYVRENVFCRDCHGQRPITHGADWFGQHGKGARSSGNDYCLVCHDSGPTDATGISVNAQTSCGSCHIKPHKDNYRTRHFPALSASDRPGETCYSCHNQNQCILCHRN
jgi:hypothetical protein